MSALRERLRAAIAAALPCASDCACACHGLYRVDCCEPTCRAPERAAAEAAVWPLLNSLDDVAANACMERDMAEAFAEQQLAAVREAQAALGDFANDTWNLPIPGDCYCRWCSARRALAALDAAFGAAGSGEPQ